VSSSIHLSPALSQALLAPAEPVSAMRAALLELVARGFLAGQKSDRTLLSFPIREQWLVRGNGRGELPAEVAPVLAALFPADSEERVRVHEALHRLHAEFGRLNPFSGYLHTHLIPPLVEAGLLSLRERRLLGLKWNATAPTVRGRELREDLRQRLRAATAAAKSAKADPQHALAVLAQVGPVSLLSAGVRSRLPRLAALAGEEGAALGLFERLEPSQPLAWTEALDVLAAVDWASAIDAITAVGSDGGDGGGDGGGE
jgi:hypothetical protein